MLDRRSLIALGMSVPVAGRSHRLDLSDARVHPLDTGGVRVVGISPDASLLVGIRDQETICVLDATTREVVAESEATLAAPLLDSSSLSWSPDGSKIAFSTRSWSQYRDSDIFVIDIVSDEMRNLTPEEHEEDLHDLIEVPEANVDTNPLWLDDDKLVFARQRFAKDEDIAVSLSTVSVSNAETDTWLDLTSAGIRTLNSPVWKISDGSLVFGVDTVVENALQYNVMIVTPDKTHRFLDLDGLRRLQLLDVSDTHIYANEVEMFEFWYIPLDSMTPPEKIWETFTLPEKVNMRSWAALGRDSETIVVAVENEKNQVLVLQLDGSGITELAELYEADGSLTLHWVDGVILVTSQTDSWLVPLD